MSLRQPKARQSRNNRKPISMAEIQTILQQALDILTKRISKWRVGEESVSRKAKQWKTVFLGSRGIHKIIIPSCKYF